MKRIYRSRRMLLAVAVLLAYASCKKVADYNDVVSNDKTKPGQVTNVKVNNFNGGAYITYTLPDAENLLYVLAEYKINDHTTRQTKVSYYSDTLTVNGFEKSRDYKVTLYAVSRADVKSDPVVVTVHPDTPAYRRVLLTVKLATDFGGVNVQCLNPLKQPIGVIVLTTDSVTGKLVTADQYYTQSDNINFSVRGYDSVSRKFAVYVTDPYGNLSDTVSAVIKPFYEVQLEKSKFSPYILPSDAIPVSTWGVAGLWDGIIGVPGHGWTPAAGQAMPLWCTFDLGETVKLSRYKYWVRVKEYGIDFAYSYAEPKTWILWGSAKPLPADIEMPATARAGDTVGDWICLGAYTAYPKPSGLPVGQNTPEDDATAAAGFEFNVPLNSPPVRYIRYECLTNWSNTSGVLIYEMTFWGAPQ